MSVKYFCDRCGFELDQRSEDTHHIEPGYVGDKLICKSCYEKWKEVVLRFFQKQGQ